MGLFEIHCHTNEVSACGWVDAKSVTRMHKDAGFEGICITDHYHEEFFIRNKQLNYKDIVKKYFSGFHSAYDEGERIGLKVFPGMEIKFTENYNDYLVYGITEDMVYDNPYMFKMGIENFSDFARKNDMLIFQAHPFRDNLVRANPVFIDGVEAINGNLRHDSRNHLSNQFAEDNNLIKIGGSDFHRECDINLIAMDFTIEILENADLVKAIRYRNYTIKQNPFKTEGQV